MFAGLSLLSLLWAAQVSPVLQAAYYCHAPKLPHFGLLRFSPAHTVGFNVSQTAAINIYFEVQIFPFAVQYCIAVLTHVPADFGRVPVRSDLWGGVLTSLDREEEGWGSVGTVPLVLPTANMGVSTPFWSPRHELGLQGVEFEPEASLSYR